MHRPSVSLVAVGAGGALGAPARYEVARLVHVSKDGFPWATFWTNASGALVLGFALTVIVRRYPGSRHARPFLATGVVGAYTTFSTLAVESDLLIRDGRPLVAATYMATSVLAGLLAVSIGIVAARRIAEADQRP